MEIIPYLMNIVSHLSEIIKNLISENPYLWIFIFMTLESTFVPLPSEIVMPPAGYFASKGILNIYIAILVGVLWSIAWASINYGIALLLGEKFSHKIMWEKKTKMFIAYFAKNWELTTFIGRLVPVVRHYISFPAWLFKMHFGKFVFYTAIWSLLWVSLLTYFGYFIWENEALLHKYKIIFSIILVILIALIVGFKVYVMKKLNKKAEENN